ncbi:MAG: CdaR family protein [bacterium]
MTKLFTLPVMRGVILVTAVIVWINVYALASKAEDIQAALLPINLSEGLAVANSLSVVNAHISGSPFALGKVNGQSLNFAIDLTTATQPGRYQVETRLQSIPAGVRLLSFTPKQLTVNIAPEAIKTVPVVIDATGWVADGVTVVSTSIDPTVATIYGAQGILDAISDVRATVALRSRRSSFSATAFLQATTADGQVNHAVRVLPEEGRVNIEIGKGAAVRNLGIKPTFAGELPGGFWVQEVNFDPSVIMVRGNQKTLDQLAYLVSTPISLSGRTSSFNDQAAVNLPSGVEVVGENLVMVRVVIGSAQDTKQISIVPKYTNVTEGFSVTRVNPISIKVVVAGDSPALQKLTRNDIVLTLDLQGALSGANAIDITPAMFSAAEGLSVVSFEPAQVEVILSRV